MGSTPNGGVCFTHAESSGSVILSESQLSELLAFLDGQRSERRIGFRVPLEPLSESVRQAFHVTLSVGKREQRALPVDLSLTGILLETDGEPLPSGAIVRLSLSFERHRLDLNARVIRSDGCLAALHFPGSLRNSELDPPAGLLPIYRALEAHWLRARSED